MNILRNIVRGTKLREPEIQKKVLQEFIHDFGINELDIGICILELQDRFITTDEHVKEMCPKIQKLLLVLNDQHLFY